jgi:hypothetical protein
LDRRNRGMAEPPPPPTMDSAIAAAVGKLQNVLMLPHGWHHSFSLRLSSDSASVLVKFSKPDLVGQSIEGKKKKRKKRSPASVKRSAERGQLHRVRQQPQRVQPQQQSSLNPLSPSFVPNSASRVVTAGSERNEDEGKILTVAPQGGRTTRAELGPPAARSEGGVGMETGGRGKRERREEDSASEIPPARPILVSPFVLSAMIGAMAKGDEAVASAAARELDSSARVPGLAARILRCTNQNGMFDISVLNG